MARRLDRVQGDESGCTALLVNILKKILVNIVAGYHLDWRIFLELVQVLGLP